MSAAAGSAGIHSPASYMRTAMDRNSRSSTSPAYPTAGGTVYASDRSGGGGTERASAERYGSPEHPSSRASTASSSSSTVAGGTVTATRAPSRESGRPADSSPP